MRIIENKDLCENRMSSEAFTGEAQNLTLVDCYSNIVAATVQGATPVDFDSVVAAALIDQGITYTAVVPGAAGNDITITLVDPGEDSALVIDVTGTDITVTLAYATGSITTDADTLVAAINLDGAASALVTASGSGSSPLSALAEDNLEGGADSEINLENSTVVATGLIQGAKVTLTTDGTLPAPLLTATPYYIIIPANYSGVVQFASSAANAAAGVAIELEDDGSVGGVHTITPQTFTNATIVEQVSNDNINWTNLGNPIAFGATSSFVLGNRQVGSKWYRVVVTIGAGSALINSQFCAFGDAI